MAIINRIPINSDNHGDHYEALIKRQGKNDKNYDTARNYDLFSKVYCRSPTRGWGTMDQLLL